MARRTFDVTGILVHWHAGRSNSEMAQSLGVDRTWLQKVHQNKPGLFAHWQLIAFT